MVNKKDNAKFMPAVAIPPGKTIRENMKYLGMNQKELALRLGITTKHLSNVINGNDPITYETALKLETVLGPKAQFWMNLETNYQLTKARLKREADLEADLEILKGVPYKSMSDFGWVPATDNRQERINNLRGFFGVASLKAVPKTMNAMLRKHKQIKGISDLGVMAWLRKAEIDGLVVKVKKFNRTKLKKYIPKFRELTLKSPEEFLPKVQKLCAECGVALVLVPSLPKTYICGATFWRRDNPILALSVRGKRADIFWFTFFHELAHLINHYRKISCVSYEDNGYEDEADEKAGGYLIPDGQYRKFIREFDYKDKSVIRKYAYSIGIAPCILVGRLLHDNLIDYANYSDLRPPFEIGY
ncbi:HigA family addiction module antitoxin [Syntrophaceticus schinkii]|jgi:HTH-type transcriptional regulator/antitoxin HigA|uniref:Plasmid maintenance system antidote protein, XRE family n=1 Tax=Syntrophaceticus schinkii TaxID=499207 RepID=A0A0B7MGU4_9FIRM|nr:HigA family addiction module antitoxin [Syntrophaceticus schinkii]CEO89844.1 Plasmid maintenance system antidote protein, XRE family [Syntrophaceticus schinkii]